MAAAETAKLIAELSLDVRKFTTGADKALGKLSKLGTKSIAVGTALGVGMERLAEAGIRKVVGAVQGGLDSLASLEDATTSVDGAIKQVGLTGKVTSAQIAAWANEIEANVEAAFDDKEITQAATTLIRFGKVAPANIKPALQVMTDLATKTGSVDSAASLLAKALADPTKAAGKLARSGVVLTKAQQDTIKAMVKAGDVAGAQKFILQQLAKATDGAAKAAHGPFRDSQLILADVVEDAQRALGTGLLPVIEEVRKELSTELAKPETLRRIREFGQGLADGFREAVKWIKSVPWDQVGAAAKGLVDFGKGLASAFMGLPTEAKSMILGLAALNKLSGGAVVNVGVDLAKGGLGTLFNQFLGKGSPVNPMYVVPVGGGLGGGAGGIAAAAKGGIGALGKVFLVGEAVGLVAAVVGVANEVRDGLSGNASEIHKTLTNSLASPQTIDDLRTKLGAIDAGIDALPKDPLGGWVTSGALSELQSMRAEVVNSIGLLGRQNLQPLPEKITAKQKASFNTLRDKIEASRIATTTRLGAVQQTTARGSDAIVRAIHGIQRPIVNVNVSQSYARITYSTGTTLSRYSGKLIPTA